jgi:hypothetical protein
LCCDVGVEPEFLVGVEGFIFVEVRVHFGDELGYVEARGLDKTLVGGGQSWGSVAEKGAQIYVDE